MPGILVYGATGFTGRLILARARELELPVLAGGRDPQRVGAVAREFGVRGVVARIDDPVALDAALSEVDVVLHCAGPFSATSAPMLDACERTQTHYLDITGEYSVVEAIHRDQARWIRAGIAVVPGVGFDTVAGDVVAHALHRDWPDARALRLANWGPGQRVSAGTAATLIELIARGGLARRGGRLVAIGLGSQRRRVAFPGGERSVISFPLAELTTAWITTGIPDIETYVALPWHEAAGLRIAGPMAGLMAIRPLQKMAKSIARASSRGPSVSSQEKGRMYVWGEVELPDATTHPAMLETLEAYRFTRESATAALQRMMSSPLGPGAHGPVQAFGPDLAPVTWISA